MMILPVVVSLLMAATVLGPQTGYIHPDEFFQSTEVVAGDVFNITHLRTWEFDPKMPLRDISLPYMLVGPAFYALRAALQNPDLSKFVSESYAIVVIPRILLVLAGLLNYRLVSRLCQIFSLNENRALWYWASSFVPWTFLTRSFSNTVETLLFSTVCLLLLDLAQCCASMKTEERVQSQYGRFKRHSFLLGVVLCMGLFNRPTFGLFVFAPLVWWVDQMGVSKLRMRFEAVTVFLSGLGFVLAAGAMSVGNSLYYNPREFSHLLRDLHMSVVEWDTPTVLNTLREMVPALRIPPLNFVQYNLLASNLAEHGLHPWYTHTLVNLPLLLGPLCVLFFWNLLALFRRCLRKQPTDVLFAMVVVPVVSLSFFPHQEARFLLPILPVAVVCVVGNRISGWKSFQALVWVFNIAAFVLFGWLHQGGVVPAMSALQASLKEVSRDPTVVSVDYHVVSYATYMPPRHLLFAGDSKIRVHVHDMIGAHNVPTLKSRMEEINISCLLESVNCRFVLLAPATAVSELKAGSGLTAVPDWKLTEEGEFCPHVSMERLPRNLVAELVGDVSMDRLSGKWLAELMERVYSVLPQFCLKVFSVTM